MSSSTPVVSLRRAVRRCVFGLSWLALLLVAMSGAGLSAQTYTSIVVFGDSLSDTGNVAHLTEAKYTLAGRVPSPVANYTNGRFTDGADTLPYARNYFGTWVEQLAATFPAKPKVINSLDGGTNYAFGSATTNTGTSTFTYGPNGAFSVTVDNMGQQVANYLATSPTITNHTLYVVWGGVNDLLSSTSYTDITAAVAHESSIIQQLINAGATDFMVPNLPPLGAIPRLNNSPVNAQRATSAALTFNQALATALAELPAANPGRALHLYPLDIYGLFRSVLNAPSAVGLTNLTYGSQTITTADPDTYLFWDDLHPTTAGHHLIALAAATLLSSPLTTSTVLNADPSSVVVGGIVRLTATVSASSGTAPVGTVTFTYGNSSSEAIYVVATGNQTSTATYTLNPVMIGSLPITATFTGINGYSNSASATLTETVTPTLVPTTTSLASSAQTANRGTAVTFTATVSDSFGSVPAGSVTFLDGTAVLGTIPVTGSGASAATATFATSTLDSGSHTITATFVGAPGYGNSTSAALTQTIVAPMLQATLSASSLSVQRGGTASTSVTLTAVGGYTGTAVIACGTLPAHFTCTPSNPSVTLTSTTPTAASTILITAGDPTKSSLDHVFPSGTGGLERVLACFLLPGIPLMGFAGRKSTLRNRLLALLSVLATTSLIGLAGCGSAAPNTPAAGNYTVPITITANSTVTTLSVSVNVQ